MYPDGRFSVSSSTFTEAQRKTHITFSGRTNKEDGDRQGMLDLGSDTPFLGEIWDSIAGKRAAHGRVDHSHHTRENNKSFLRLHSMLAHTSTTEEDG